MGIRNKRLSPNPKRRELERLYEQAKSDNNPEKDAEYMEYMFENFPEEYRKAENIYVKKFIDKDL